MNSNANSQYSRYSIFTSLPLTFILFSSSSKNQAEIELRRAQEEFDKQVEIVSNICNKIITSNEQHVKYLSKFIEAQAEYYQQANKHLNDLLNNKTDDSNSEGRSNSTGFASLAAFAAGNSTEEWLRPLDWLFT